MPEFQPNFIVIDPVTGEISFNFPGAVTLPVAVIGEEFRNMVRWVREGDSSVMAELFCLYDPPPGPIAEAITTLKTFLPDDAGNLASRTRMTAEGNFEGVPPQVRLASLETLYDDAADVGEVSVRVATSNLNVREKLLLDTFGNSDFIKYAATDQVTFEVGGVAVSFPGSANGTGTINHNLGGVPSGVVFGVQNSAAGNIVIARQTFGATTISVLATTNTGAAIGPGSVNCHWLAWRFV